MTQGFGKLPFAFNWSGADMALRVGAQAGRAQGRRRAGVARAASTLPRRSRGGGQEMGRRSGTENVIGIAGFGAAAEAAARDLAAGVWDAGRRT